MPENKSISRRLAVKSSIFGIMAVSLPHASYAKSAKGFENDISGGSKLLNRYPSIDDIIVAEVVGASHFNLDRVKELVDARPELARATWDWGFGDCHRRCITRRQKRYSRLSDEQRSQT